MHEASYYAATAHASPEHPTLQGSVETDVCVIGGGISGCATALNLVERGFRVVLLEGRKIGWGASGRSGGQALVGYASGQEKLIAQLGRDDARKLWNLSVESLDILRERVARHAIDCDLHWGALHVATKPRQREELLSEHQELQSEYGYPTEFLDRSAIEALLATKRYYAGVLDRRSAHLHPLNYTLGLARAAIEQGATIYERSLVKDVRAGSTVNVVTDQGEVRAKFVALCCNAYIGDLNPKLSARIMPVGTYIVATESLGEARITQLIRENFAVSDLNFVLDYFRRSADHRLLFGGRVSYSGHDAFNTASATRKRMLQVFPQLSDVKIDYAWGGFVDITMSRAPDFGRLAPNIYYVQGFSGHGIALTGLAGKLVADAIAGQAERFDLFAKIEHHNFPGGPLLRMPSLVLAMMWYRLRDLL